MSPFIRLLTLFSFGALLISCAGNRHLRYVEKGERAAVPRFLELADEQTISTLHFPAGVYSLDSEDDDGYYYRALQRVVKHSFAGPAPQNAGIFVSKRNRRVRAYVTWAGGRTKSATCHTRESPFAIN